MFPKIFTRSFQAKLLYLMIAVLIVLQAATLLAVHFAGQRTMRAGIADELHVGSNVLDQILAARGRQLSDTARVLASDFAFREAIASGDRPTITSVLTNHGSRIGANVMTLVALDGTIVADTANGGGAFPFAPLVRDARQRGEASAIVSFHGRPHQVVLVP